MLCKQPIFARIKIVLLSFLRKYLFGKIVLISIEKDAIELGISLMYKRIIYEEYAQKPEIG
jgi:hypothetical protein